MGIKNLEKEMNMEIVKYEDMDPQKGYEAVMYKGSLYVSDEEKPIYKKDLENIDDFISPNEVHGH